MELIFLKRSIKYSAAGVLCALSVIFLAAGSIVWVFAYTMPLICGIINIMAIRTFDKRTAFVIYTATSILSLFLLGDKETALIYALFFGFYPIIRESINALKPYLKIPIKFIVFNAGIVAAELICVYVFMIPFDSFLGKWGAVIMLALGNLIFIIYDRLLDVLIIIYEKKYKSRIDRLLK